VSPVLEFRRPPRCPCGGHPFEGGRCIWCVAADADRRAAADVAWFEQLQRAERARGGR
jgi:hypothetical protein